jgi:hypothetical protein
LRFQNATQDHDDRPKAAAASNLAAFSPDNDILALEAISKEPHFMEPISSASFQAPTKKGEVLQVPFKFEIPGGTGCL